MSAPFAHFRSIRVARAPGIPRGEGWLLDDLSHGFNLIHGPNGSGKTTTARAIQELLWPGHVFGEDRPTVSGELSIAGGVQRIEIEAGHLVGPRPQAGSPDRRRRYWLAFDDLIRRDDADFAQAVVDEMMGGYDLAGAAEALDYSGRPTEPRGLAGELDAAKQKVSEAARRQREVEEHADKLAGLRREHQAAVDAAREAGLLEQALDHHRIAGECGKLEDELASLPSGVSKLYGNEQETLDDLAAKQKDCRQELDDSRLASQRAGQALAESGLGGDGLTRDLLPRVRGLLSDVRTVEAEIARSRGRVVEAEAVRDTARRRLGEHLDESGAAAVERVELPELMPLARKADEARARRQALVERRRWLEQESGGLDEAPHAAAASVTVEELQEGIGALSRWLAVSGGVGEARNDLREAWPLLAGAVLVVLLAVVLAIVHHWAWLAAAIAGGALLLVGWPRRSTAPIAGDERIVHRRAFQQTSLPAPAAWDADGVARRMSELCLQLAQNRLANECARKLAEVSHDERRLAAELEQHRDEREALEARLGIALRVEHDEWLPLLVESQVAWHRASDAAAAGRAELADLERRRDVLLEQTAEALAPFGSARHGSAAEAEQVLQDLADRQQRHSQAQRDLAAADERSRRAGEELDALGRQRAVLLGRLGLAEEQAALVADWLGQLPRLRELERELARQRGVRDRLAAGLAGHAHLGEMDEHALGQRRDAALDLAGRQESVQGRIAAIDAEISQAKRGHDLTDALAARDAAEAKLQDARDACRRSVVGSALIDWLRTHSSQSEQPAVLRRANELLVKVTAGALRLDVKEEGAGTGAEASRGRGRAGDASPAEFVAVVEGQKRGLKQLSLGERTQVLMAVRLAFMEHDEATALPLILDEVLANADDRRATVLIDVLLDFVCAEGEVCRQVFCFTAQHDEAGKWLGLLESRHARGQAMVPYKEIDLAKLRRQVESTEPVTTVPVVRRQVPEPGGDDWEAYGRRLKVPRLDPSRGPDGQHIWHVVHEPQAVYSLLSLGVRTWGQLRTMLEHGGNGLPQLDGHVERARAAAEVIEALCEGWRRGRGRPIDRGVLERAEAVTETFLDRVCDLARECEWDARRLLEELEGGRVPRWRQDNTDRLEELLREEGYLDGEEPLSREELEARVAAVASRHEHEGRLPAGWLRAVLATAGEAGERAGEKNGEPE